jgi:hypothetical protein
MAREHETFIQRLSASLLIAAAVVLATGRVATTAAGKLQGVGTVGVDM